MFFSDNLPIVKDLPSPEGKWELVEVIGEGNYGEVFKAVNVQTGEIAAVKVMEAVLDKEEDIKAELNVFESHSHHPNIVSFFGAFVKKDPIADDQLWIVMGYCSGGSVTDLVKIMKEKGESLPEDVISYILREVLEGLSYLHQRRVLHRDIKGENVLFTNDGYVKLIDFGISAVVDKSLGRRRTTIGTPYWMAPEVIACEQQLEYDYDARADVWSLGITAIEIADSTPPLFGENPMRALFKIPKNKSPTVRHPSKWSRQFNNFIARCVVKDFEKRPTSHELLSHEFVRFVPKNPKVLRYKLISLLDTYQHGETIDHSSTSTSGVDTAKRNCLRALQTSEMVNDLATLEYIDESVIISQLMKRYQKRKIYTYVGDILVSINPFQKLDIYNQKYSNMYCNAPGAHYPPHIFAVADSAYQAMVREQRDQCCVVSGESGAGKTEASNILVQQFMTLGRAETRLLEEKILQVNPLMESFGNARTVINDNSSRFGKYLELHFTPDGHIVGARLTEYLLEKSRVVSQARREKNFHIFYYLMAGLGTRQQLGRYKLRGAHHHRYLEHRGTGKGSAKRNALFSERFDLIENAFYLFGFSRKEFESVCSILAAILNIGDIRLDTDFHSHIGEVSAVSNRDLIDDVAELLQIKPDRFEMSVTTSQVVTYGETIVRPNTIEQAMDARDAMAKALYGRLFSWIVNKINPALNPPSDRNSKVMNIGILDIFGFENFRTNSFEQLLINIANEQLQFYFNQHIFAWEQDEYIREGIDVTHVGYEDNRPLLEMLLSQPMGLLALLDEESKFPQATDLSLAAKFHTHFQSLPNYRRPKDRGPMFTILHYAGPVSYETTGFLEKNRDTLRPDVSTLLKRSGNDIVRALFFTPLSRTGSLLEKPTANKVPPSATPLFSRRAPIHGQRGQQQQSNSGRTPLSFTGNLTGRRPQTVSTYFINSLRELMAKMLAGTPHFVRCIRPNELKSPDQFQPEKVLMQLRYTGVLETTRIRKEGYSHRILFVDFIQRYKVISYPLSKHVVATPTNCVQILMQAGMKKWAMGKTKVFLKYYHVERLLQILNNYDRSAVKIQKVVRGWLSRRKVAILKQERRHRAAVMIQAVTRGFLARCRVQRMIMHREQAALTIQTAVRVWLAQASYLRILQSRHVSAIKIQSVIRMWLCRRHLLSWKQHRGEAAMRIQKVVRGWLTRRRFGHLKEEAIRRRQGAWCVDSLRSRLQRKALVMAREIEERIRDDAKGLKRDDVREKSATIIQRAYRTMVARRHKQALMKQREQEERKMVSRFLSQMEFNGLEMLERQHRTASKFAVSIPGHRNPRPHRTSSPKAQGKQLQRQVIRHGDRVLWRPSVMSYYEQLQMEQLKHPQARPSSALSASQSQTEQTRRIFEELIAKQTQEATRTGLVVQPPSGSPSLGVLRQRALGSSGALRDESLVHRQLVSPLVRRQYKRSERSSPDAIRASSLMVQRKQNDLRDKPHVQLKVPSPGAVKDGPLQEWSAAGSSSQEVGQNRPLDRSRVKPQEVSQNRPLDHSRVKPQEVSQNRPLDHSRVKPQEVGQNHPLDHSRVKPQEVGQNHPLDHSRVIPQEVSQNHPLDRSRMKSQEVGQNRPLDRSRMKPQEVGQNLHFDHSRMKPQEVGQNRPLDRSRVKPQEVGQNHHFDRSRMKPLEVGQNRPLDRSRVIMRPRLQSKPGSVIQRLLDRFDPIRFGGARTPQEVRS